MESCCLCARKFQTLFVFIGANDRELLTATFLQRQRVTAGTGFDVERAAFFRQLYVFIYKRGEPLAPIGGDVEVLKEGEFFSALGCHEDLTTEDTEEGELD